jgi:nucleoside-diphosphate-sugar epimerase
MESRKIFPLTVIFMKEYFNIYNLEGSQKITVLEVAKGIRDVSGEHVKIEFVPERPGDFGGKEVTGKKAWQELGWKPKVEFEEGLRLTVGWFRKKWGK